MEFKSSLYRLSTAAGIYYLAANDLGWLSISPDGPFVGWIGIGIVALVLVDTAVDAAQARRE